jgi:HlyD family secretion protein
MKRWITIGVIVALVAAGIVLALREPPVQVDFADATPTTVREYITEDGTTRLDDEYLVAMPVMGTLLPLEVEVGDVVEKGQVVAQVDPHELQQQISGVKALIEQTRAQIAGVDVMKPKAEDIASAEVRVEEVASTLAMTQRELNVVELNLQEAKRNFDRAKELHAQGAISQSQFDEALTAYESLQENQKRAQLGYQAAQKAQDIAQLQSQRVSGSIDDNEYMRAMYEAQIENFNAQLAMLEYDLAKTQILAPVAGPIMDKFVDDRRVMMAGTPILRMGDLNTIEVESDILSEEVGRVEEGDPVEIYGKAVNDSIVPGKVTQVYPSGFMKISALGIQQQRVKVIVGFDNSEIHLRPGTRVDVRIITAESRDALAVPERATFRQEGAWHVFIVEGGRARLTPVEIGLKNDEWAEILKGLEPGQTVVADPKNEIEDGTRVQPLE